MAYKVSESPDAIMSRDPNNYYLAIKSGNELYLSNKKFLLTSEKPSFQGQYLSSSWFNPCVKAKNYKNNIWLAIVKISKANMRESRKSAVSQLLSAQGESWGDLKTVVCCVKYNWECFYEDVTDGSKYLRCKENNCKMVEVSLPCIKRGDDSRINFTVAMTYNRQHENKNYSSEHLFRDPDNQKYSDILQVSIQCPSFTICTN